ncbi:hypothetical protein ACQKP8_05115 [Photobacterium alginatilyticum]|uniref:hypothetical protein n=1 Tax=Photobacterium alginatilyticum TaxID=1775171 RepID=UPI00406849C6
MTIELQQSCYATNVWVGGGILTIDLATSPTQCQPVEETAALSVECQTTVKTLS